MDPDRPSKLRKLENLRRCIPHASAAALSSLLEEVQRDGVPDLHNRNHFREAANTQLLSNGPYGSLLTTMDLRCKDGKMKQVGCVNPLALLYASVYQGGSMEKLFKRLFAETGSSVEKPWRIILYADEVVPGNVISYDNRRKVWVVYFSFMEFGQIRLQAEDAWFCVLAARSSDLQDVSGGISQVMAGVLKFFSPLWGTTFLLLV